VAGICFAVNAVLVAVIYLLDVRFMEAGRPPASRATPGCNGSAAAD